MSGPPLNPIYYPFASVPSTSNSNVFPYDIVIDTVYPGLIFDAQEAGAAYSVIREVEGCLWFVLNADFDETTLQWTQEDPTNPNTSAYAMELCAAGTWNWYSGAPTLIPGTPVTWRQVFLIDANGSVISTPQTVTTSINGSEQLLVTWNAGSLTQVTARFMNVTDTSSAANSILDNMAVNGVSKWQVDKTGTLQVGIIPYARITGAPAPPSFNNPTFTGTSTFTGPVVMDDGLSVTGAATDLSVLNVSTGATISGGLTVPNGEAVTGGLSTDTLTVSGIANLNGGSAVTGAFSVSGTSNLHNVVIASGDTITINGTTPVVTLESITGTINVTQVSPVEYNIGVNTASSSLSYPIGGSFVTYGANGTSLTVPSVGSVWNVVCQSYGIYNVSGTPNSILVTGTGGTDGGAWAGGTDTFVNVDTGNFQQYTLQLNGLAHSGDTVTCTATTTGSASLTSTNILITAIRVS